MFTRPKLTDPFQVVRMSRGISVEGRGGFVLAACSPATTFCVGADELEDDRESVAQRDGRGPPGRCVPRTRSTASGVRSPGPRRPRRSTSWRTACSPSACRRATSFALLGRTIARVGALRLRARPGRSRRGADLREQLCARRRSTCSSTRTLSACSSRTTTQRAKVAGLPLENVIAFVGARRTARPRTCLRGGAADGARRARGLDRRGRPVHLHLHVGNDRPAEGVHDPPPQLLRDGAEGRRDGRSPDGARRRDAPLPPARPQLRAPAASLGGVHRLHDRVPARSAARGDASCRVCDRRCSRACRASTRRSTRRSSTKFDEATGVQRKLIDWALAVGRDVSKLRQAQQPVPRGLALRHKLADRLVYSKVKERLGGQLRVGECGRRAALA